MENPGIKDWKLELGSTALAAIGTGACRDENMDTCEDAIPESQCQCTDCEWTVDVTGDDLEIGDTPPMPQDCSCGQSGIIAISMMLLTMCWMRLNRHRSRGAGRSG